MAATFVLVHSPLVGPGTWADVAAILRARGHRAIVPDLSSVLRDGPPFYSKLIEAAAAPASRASSERLFLAGHSGAGGFLPAIAAACGADGLLYADANLPHPGRCWFDTAPADLVSHLRNIARDGRVPPWQDWWPPGAVAALLGDDAIYTRFTAELQSLPLTFFEEKAPVFSDGVASAYLRLSAACEPEAARMEHDGYRVDRMDLHHLAVLTHPREVALRIENLAAAL